MILKFSNEALKTMDKLDTKTSGRVMKAIFGLPNKGDIVPLEGQYKGFFRMRVGDWRIIYGIVDSVIMIDKILPRGDAYKH